MRVGGGSDWAYLVATFHRPGRGPVGVKPRTGGRRGTHRFANKHKSGLKKRDRPNIERNFRRSWKRMRLTSFLSLLLPVLVRAIPEAEATTLKGERDADELERVKRGFYT